MASTLALALSSFQAFRAELMFLVPMAADDLDDSRHIPIAISLVLRLLK